MSLNRFVAISVDPAVEVGAFHAVEMLRRSGWRSQLFTMTGEQQSSFENTLLHNPSIAAVLELSLSDLSAVQLGVRPKVVPERLTSAAMLGIPQVIVPGCLDHVIISSNNPVPIDREQMALDQVTTLIRTSAEDCDALGKELAFKASASHGIVKIVFPRGGLSSWDVAEQPDYDSQMNQALLDSLLLWKSPAIELIESHRHINDSLFIQIVVDQLLKLLVVRR